VTGQASAYVPSTPPTARGAVPKEVVLTVGSAPLRANEGLS
jgi:hypothetical protein